MSELVRKQIAAARDRVGERMAMVCPRPDCSWREFGNAEAVCPTHGEGERQVNRAYFGEST